MKPTMTNIVHLATREWRYGVRILEVNGETNEFTVLDESEGWTSKEQAERYVENTKECFEPIVNAKWEIQIYRYKVTVENLCGKQWNNVI